MIHRHQDRRLIYEDGANRGWELANLERHAVVELAVADLIAPHQVPFAMTFYVVAGTGICEVAGNAQAVARGDVIAVEPGLERSWRNTGKTLLEVLCIRGPALDSTMGDQM